MACDWNQLPDLENLCGHDTGELATSRPVSYLGNHRSVRNTVRVRDILQFNLIAVKLGLIFFSQIFNMLLWRGDKSN